MRRRAHKASGAAASTPLADACTAFHNYQIKWTANAIAFYLDGVAYRPAYVNPSPGVANNAWPFDKPQYLLLNLAVGGDWGGAKGIDQDIWPQKMEIDYVRVYQ